ncbi:hypothetical protein RhiJN_24197 [Ceratobasidium sp. AG-Ba]|nr:hypothetical protein RhiJN_24197 [Ceratobasidium sp. AG-Ba]
MTSESPTWRLPPSSFTLPRGELIGAYEAEEERITNVLVRKLEQLREEKMALENTLEHDSDSHVNRLTRQISQLQAQLSQSSQSSASSSSRPNPEPPQPFMLLEAMRLENAQLRSRVSDLERDFLRVSRINEVYRQELLEHRRRLGIPYESLIGLAASASQSVSSSPVDTFSHPNRRIPTASHNHTRSGPSIGAVPIPRVQSQTRIHPEILALTAPPSSDSTPPSSPSYSLSPTAPLFPGPSSQMTTLTTPASNPLPPHPPPQPLSPPTSTSNGLARALTELASAHAQRAGLTYPSVPPPSLASSLGSGSPVVPTLRVPPNSRRQSAVAETGSLRPGLSGVLGVGGGREELEEIGEDEDSAFEEEYQPRAGLEIGRGRGRGRGGGGGGIMGLGLTGTR